MENTTQVNSADYAGFWVRAGSVAIDSLILSFAATLVSILLLQLMHAMMSTETFLQYSLFFVLPFSLLLQFFYFVWLNANGRQTVGKKFFGIAVVDASFKPISFLRSLGRTVAFVFDTIIIGLGHLLMLFNHKKKTLHDTLAKTYVVRVKPERRYEALLAVAALIVLIFIPTPSILRNYVQAFRIPTGAHKSTMLIGDFILVDKYWARKNTPERGDIIIFKYPLDPSLEYIKRCIGLPGDSLEMRDGVVWVNGKPEALRLLAREYDPEEGHYTLEYEVNSEGRQPYRIRHYEDHNFKAENYGLVVIPQDHYFMMGDNRDNSSDSRYWGFLPKENIVGKAGIIYLSWERAVPIYRLTAKIRWSRIGTVLR
jgi:signal peptidase I